MDEDGAEARQDDPGEVSPDEDLTLEDLPLDDIAYFIVQVRKLCSQSYRSKGDYSRVMHRLKNLSTRLYRDNIGYRPDGSYCLKPSGKRVFSEEVAKLGGRDKAIGRVGKRNPVLNKILRGQEGQGRSPEMDEDPPPPLHLVPKEPPMPEWAGEFDPESSEPAGGPKLRPPELVDLDALGDDPELANLAFETVDLDEDDLD